MSKTELESHLVYGINEKFRRIFFGVPIDSSHENNSDFSINSVGHIIRAMDKMISEYPKKPIEIHMNSYGGDPYALLYLHDYILAASCQVKFFGGGAIMSAATWIMAVCDERYLYPHATIMVHNGWESLTGNYEDVHIAADESKRLMEVLFKIYAENSHMPKEFWREVCKRDLYLTAKEAVTLGLADKIVEPQKRGNFRKARAAHLSKKVDHRTMKSIVNKLFSRVGITKLPEVVLNEHKPEEVDESLIIDETPVELPQPIKKEG